MGFYATFLFDNYFKVCENICNSKLEHQTAPVPNASGAVKTSQSLRQPGIKPIGVPQARDRQKPCQLETYNLTVAIW